MTTEQLTATLAERVMGWRVSPDRFLMGERGWKPRWKFQPMTRLADAVRLLEAANPEACDIKTVRGGGCAVRVVIGGRVGQSSDASNARAITGAIAMALDIESEGPASNLGRGGRK